MPGQAERVLILGHGAMGRMFEALLAPRHDLLVWDRDLRTGEETQPLETAAVGRGVVLFALPASPHEELAGRLAPLLGPDTLCVSIAKGLDSEGRTPAQVFARHLDGRSAWALIYGPMLARELQAGRPGFALAASAQPGAARRLQALFAHTHLHLDPSDDVHGAAWAAILKNVYVPLIGAIDELALGDNLRGLLLADAVRELGAIIQTMGGRAATSTGLAGLGDLIASATGASSHHRRLGADLVLGVTERLAASGVNIRSEGVHTTAMVRAHRPFDIAGFPLFELVCRFFETPNRLASLLDGYISRRFDRTAP